MGRSCEGTEGEGVPWRALSLGLLLPPNSSDDPDRLTVERPSLFPSVGLPGP